VRAMQIPEQFVFQTATTARMASPQRPTTDNDQLAARTLAPPQRAAHGTDSRARKWTRNATQHGQSSAYGVRHRGEARHRVLLKVVA
jgi:hypothetical protein